MVPGSQFNADFSNNSPLVVANFNGANAQFISESSYLNSNQKLNFKGRRYTYEKPFIDGPLIHSFA